MHIILRRAAGFGRSEEGANALEFALVLPVLLTLLFGIMEGSRAVNAWMVVTQATRAGARFAITGSEAFTSSGAVNPSLTSDIKAQVSTYASNMGVNLMASDVTVTCLDSSGSAVKCSSITDLHSIGVQSTYTVNMLIPLIQALTNSITITAASTMRAE